MKKLDGKAKFDWASFSGGKAMCGGTEVLAARVAGMIAVGPSMPPPVEAAQPKDELQSNLTEQEMKVEAARNNELKKIGLKGKE